MTTTRSPGESTPLVTLFDPPRPGVAATSAPPSAAPSEDTTALHRFPDPTTQTGEGSVWVRPAAEPTDSQADPIPALEAPSTAETGLPWLDAEPQSTTRPPRAQPHGVIHLGGGDPQRFEDLGLIGKGGMGEVRRVRDPDLKRTMALKLIHASLVGDPDSVSRFIEEAQITAQLQHPGIVAVHGMGRLDDGRVWFTMPEVRGRTLRSVIRDVHRASKGGDWVPTDSGWTLRRLIDAFHTVCQAVAFAHAHGVLHRDLKPDNVMVGAYGEVQVLDWGLAKLLRGPSEEAESWHPPQDRPTTDGHRTTHIGRVMGTPAYMAPEQASGRNDEIGTHTDVYALGGLLFEVLTGHSPFSGKDAAHVIQQVKRAHRQPLQASCPIPRPLAALVEWAMQAEPAARCPSAEIVAEKVGDWLDGARRRTMALAIVEQADELGQGRADLETRGAALRAESKALLASVQDWEPESRKALGWARADEADRVQARDQLLALRQQETLRSALHIVSDLPEAHQRLADIYRKDHAQAEARRDTAATLRLAYLLRQHDVAAHHQRYLKGEGALSLVTEPPGAEVLLHRYETQERRLVAVFDRSLGHTPLRTRPLAMGSYLLVLRAPGFADTRYPVHITRGRDWDTVPPGAEAPQPVRLLPELDPRDVHVPGGPYTIGGVPGQHETEPRRTAWLGGFIIRRFPVTNREYLDFLDDLIAHGQEPEAMRIAPRVRPGVFGEQGALVYGRDSEGRFTLKKDPFGNGLLPEYPVCQVDWHGATAYAAWLAARTGHPWRLPTELEWEKASRGVDGRFFPWGDTFEESRGNMSRSQEGLAKLESIDSFPLDESPYGVRGMAGNARDWTADPFVKDRPPDPNGWRTEDLPPDAARVVRGGSWTSRVPRAMNAAYRMQGPATARDGNLSFRLVRDLPGASGERVHIEPGDAANN
jgi:eukaryotic-like serine/threonine-protein kinase